ncbi:unnamed protein product [Cyprideis torosa]|uniref:glutathione-specific gamma-glutamylcyclotransferase n=1 Tax=Cyprideis torosa TaxID=163714 RepID=A0A7R8WMI3_9CRUS|nr:unnamed protein product [Cyprideis torosa]CAG0903711.1 unnamed protein product [Cyprideis torosa]
MASAHTQTPEFWVFGYGSLLWKVDFPVEERLVGVVKGYTRRFWQASIDHRGTPEHPGRVVTLIPASPEEDVLGIAYRAPLVDVDRVIAHLNNREKGGYEKFQVLFHPLQAGMSPFNVDIYVGRHDNPFFVLNEDLEVTAQRIATAKGPSGTNAEYFFQLMASLRNLDQSHKDLYLEALEAAIIKIQLAKGPPHEP